MLAGTTVADRFAIESEVGSGGMGTIYRAVDRARGVPVAVKVLVRHETRDLERFARETAVLADLSHPAIATYVAHGELPDQRLYYVMEWIDGTTLGELVFRDGLTVAESVKIVRLIADALGHAHTLGILHRDLKPSNVMLEHRKVERAKLIDFGLARRLREATKLTQTGSTIGTPGYMAPEQVRGERALDERADVFALGCLLYECLAGVPAFAGGNWLLVQSRILLAAPPPLSGVPPELARVVDGMLAKEKAKRTPDCAAVIAALDALPPIGPTPRRSAHGLHFDGTQRAMPAWRFPAETESFVVAVVEEPPDTLGATIGRFGAELSRIQDGAVVIRVIPGANERASERAEQCAQALRAVAPDAPIVIARSSAVLEEATRVVLAAEIAILFGQDVPPIRVL